MHAKNKKWLFVQLPVISHDLRENLAHCPYAACVLYFYLQKQIRHIEVIRLDRTVETFGSDDLIIRTILDIAPDVLCLSLYLWNVERSLYVAEKIKEKRPDTIVVIGGPEVNLDNGFILKRGGFDIGIIGEGERILLELVRGLESKSWRLDLVNSFFEGSSLIKGKIFLSGKPTDLSKIPPVYPTSSCVSYDGSILLESLRGCVHSCKYCYYHKKFKHVRYFSLQKVIQELKWAWDVGINEISFIDPSFLRRKRPGEFLNKLYEFSHGDGPSIFCELNAEDVTGELAELLRKINVNKVEVGLQTINEVALSLINRKFNRKKFISGIEELKTKEISILLDLIVGLPGDRSEDVLKGVEFVLDNDLMDDLGIYPLCVLPGTELRFDANRFGLDYLDFPPYLVKKTKTMDMMDIKEVFLQTENKTQIDLFPREFPIIAGKGANIFKDNVSLIYLLDLTNKGICLDDFVVECLDRLMCSILIYVSHINWLLNNEKFFKLYDVILKINPHILIDIVIDDNCLKDISFDKIMDIFKHILVSRNFYMDRIYVDTIDPIRSTQLFLRLNRPGGKFVLVSIPSTIYSRREESVFWFKIYGEEDMSLEEYFLDKFSYVTNIEDFSYRISYAQDYLEPYRSIFPLGKREISF